MAYSLLYTLTRNGSSANFQVTGSSSVNADVSDTLDGNNDGLVSANNHVLINGIDYTYTGYLIGSDPVVQNGGSYYLYSNTAGLTGTQNGASSVYAVCFLPGTLIATPEGERAIETLAIGDLITLAGGKEKAVKWIGEMTVNLNLFNRHTASPILIRAGALGHGLPKRDLYTSYHHGFELEGALVIAGVLVNGTSIVQCSDWPEQTLKFYQVEVEGHVLMLVEGAPAETFGEDGDDRALFDNASEYHALYPNAVPAEQMGLGRVSVARQLPRAVKERIEAAAVEMGYAKAAVA